jgi:hypothetical protein
MKNNYQVMAVVAVALAVLGSGRARGEEFAKGSPVQIVTKQDKTYAGRLETGSGAGQVGLVMANQQTVAVAQNEIREVRLLKSSRREGLKGKMEEFSTRGTGDFTEQLSAGFQAFFSDKDVPTSSGKKTSFAQVILDDIHPNSTFVRAKVNDVRLYWKGDKAPDDLKKTQKMDVRVTLYWKGAGIITSDGYTQVAMTFDNEVERWTKLEVLGTNGVKTEDVAKGVIDIALIALTLWTQDQ